MTKLWGDEAGRATKTDRILVLGADRGRPAAGAGRRRAAGRLDLAARRAALRCQSLPRPPRGAAILAAMQQMYHPDDLASMDPLVLMKNLDHVRMTSRRLSYILQQQVHLYVPEANELRERSTATWRRSARSRPRWPGAASAPERGAGPLGSGAATREPQPRRRSAAIGVLAGRPPRSGARASVDRHGRTSAPTRPLAPRDHRGRQRRQARHVGQR